MIEKGKMIVCDFEYYVGCVQPNGVIVCGSGFGTALDGHRQRILSETFYPQLKWVVCDKEGKIVEDKDTKKEFELTIKPLKAFDTVKPK